MARLSSLLLIITAAVALSSQAVLGAPTDPKFKPLHDRIIVKPLSQDSKTRGGIIIPDTAKEKPVQGEVISKKKHRKHQEEGLNINVLGHRVNIKPLHDRIIVKTDQGGSKTSGGIIIPDTAKEKPQEGVVVAVGPGKVSKSRKK